MNQPMEKLIEALLEEGYFAAKLKLLQNFSEDENPNMEYYLQAAKLGLTSIDKVVYCYSKYGHILNPEKHKQIMYDDFMIDCCVSGALESFLDDLNFGLDDVWNIEIEGRVVKEKHNMHLINFSPYNNNYPNRIPYTLKFELDICPYIKNHILQMLSNNDSIVLSAKPMLFEFIVKEKQ